VSVEIRRARAGDVPALVAAYEWLFAPPGAQPPSWDPVRARSALASGLDGNRSTVLVATDARVDAHRFHEREGALHSSGSFHWGL
jgi:hypothetical protein